MTSSPSLKNRSHRCDPMNPAPPVMTVLKANSPRRRPRQSNLNDWLSAAITYNPRPSGNQCGRPYVDDWHSPVLPV